MSPLAVSFLCHFPSAFAAWGFPSVLPCGVRTFLEPPKRPAVTRPATRILAALPPNRSPRAGPSCTPGTRSRRPRRRTNSPQTRHSRLTPRASASSSCSSVRLKGDDLHHSVPEHSDDLAEDLDVRRVDRLERVVLGLEPDAAALAEEALHRRLVGRLVVAGERDHDVAVPRVLLRGARRRCRRRGCRPGSSSRPSRAAGSRRRRATAARARASVVLDVLLGEQRAAGRDLADERQLRARSSAAPRAPARAPTSSSARGFVGSRLRSPARSRFARCACTVEGEASPTASPISRTVGG